MKKIEKIKDPINAAHTDSQKGRIWTIMVMLNGMADGINEMQDAIQDISDRVGGVEDFINEVNSSCDEIKNTITDQVENKPKGVY